MRILHLHYPLGPLPPLRLPVLPGLPSEITETLGRDYPGLYEQAQLTL